jgi:hypothetical protein
MKNQDAITFVGVGTDAAQMNGALHARLAYGIGVVLGDFIGVRD